MTVRKVVQHLIGDTLGTVADVQGTDATSELLLQVVDRLSVDSKEYIDTRELVRV